jgi:hypothetical protein
VVVDALDIGARIAPDAPDRHPTGDHNKWQQHLHLLPMSAKRLPTVAGGPAPTKRRRRGGVFSSLQASHAAGASSDSSVPAEPGSSRPLATSAHPSSGQKIKTYRVWRDNWGTQRIGLPVASDAAPRKDTPPGDTQPPFVDAPAASDFSSSSHANTGEDWDAFMSDISRLALGEDGLGRSKPMDTRHAATETTDKQRIKSMAVRSAFSCDMPGLP